MSGPARRAVPAPAAWKVATLRGVARAILGTLGEVTVTGAANVPKTGACLLAFNHPGRLDGPLLFATSPRDDLAIMVADIYPGWRAITRTVIASGGGVWLDRDVGDHEAVAIALALLAAGRPIAIAPEGRVSADGRMGATQHGPAYLAEKAGVPVVPVAITGTERVRANLKRLRRTPLSVTFGEPFVLPPVDPADRKARLRADADLIMCRIAALLPDERHGTWAGCPRPA